MTRPVIAVSGCIAGEAVRFDGGHGKDKFLLNQVAPLADLVTFCPEYEAGMGAPRETIRLVRQRKDGLTSVVGNKSGEDWTERLQATCDSIADRLAAMDLSGIVVRRNSPTCGMERVRVYDWNQVPSRDGVGLFVQTLRRRFPLLAIEEDGRLHDARLREAFFERVFAHSRLRELLDDGLWTRSDVVRFHSREKLLLLSHSPRHYRELGSLVARVKELPREAFAEQYQALFLTCLAQPASPGRQVNALQHAAGFLKKFAASEEKARLSEVISDYGSGLLPLAVPIAVLRAGIARQSPSWLSSQTWLDPHPKQLRLRTWVP